MIIRRWHCYIVFNCAFIIPCLLGKPVSLNAIIAAEEQKAQVSESTSKYKAKGLVGKSVSLNALIAAENQKKHGSESSSEQKIKETAKNYFESNEAPFNQLNSKRLQLKATPRIKQISLLKDRRSDINGIKSLLKPQELLNKLRKKRKSKSNKRAILHNEVVDSDYISLFRNLNNFFDKVLHNDAGAANKRKGKYKHNKIITKRNGMVCTCQQESGLERTKLIKSSKKTTAHATTVSPEVSSDSKIAAETTTDSAMAHIRSIGSNKNLPLLLSRNPLSSWRNHNGHSKRSSSAFHGDIKRNITWNYGNSQYNSRIGENESHTESYEEDTYSVARNGSSSDGFRRRDGNDTRNSDDRKKTDEDIKFKENQDGNDRSSKEFNGKITIQTGRDETGSQISLPEYVGGLRGHVPEDQVSANTEPIRSQEDHEKSNNYVTLDSADDQRIANRNGSVTTETEDVSTENITVISIKDLSNLTLALQSAPKGNLPVVTIFGGYSVAKDINGQNKLSEQSIHIYS